MFNKKITAKEAVDRNLVTAVFPDEVFVKETEAMIKGYSQLPKIVSQCYYDHLHKAQM